MSSVLLEAVQPAAAGSSPELPTLLLSAIVWVPTIAAVTLLFFPARTEPQRSRIRSVAIATAALVAVLGLLMWYGFQALGQTVAYEEKHAWMPSLGAGYHLGVDGVNMPLVLLSTVLFLVVALGSHRVRERVKEYFVLLLILETGANGAFASLDYLLFFLFWQMQAIPLFFLIGIWGGARRMYAAWKYLFFGLTSSALLLLAILIIYAKAPTHTFDMVTLHDARLPVAIAALTFWLFFGAFAIQLPVFPVHTWFVDAQKEAPAPVAAVLAGITGTLGGYGLFRVNAGQLGGALHTFATPVLVLALVAIFWSALAALREDDLRRLIGYVTMSRMGLVLLAAAAAAPVAVNGGVLFLVANGLTSALLILLAAAVIERTDTSSIRALGGLAFRMPRGAALWALGALASIGLPGLAGFTAQLLIFLGAYPAQRTGTFVALLGTLLVAAVMVGTLPRLFFGPIAEGYSRIGDLGTLELTYSVTLVVLMVLFGILPSIVMDSINLGVLSLLTGGAG